MHRFLKGNGASRSSPPKRARLNQGPPSVAEQHAFLDAGKKRNWASVRDSLASSQGFVNVQPLGRWSVLHHAAEAGNVEMVKYLLEQRADVTVVTKDGKTPSDVTSNKDVLYALTHASDSSCFVYNAHAAAIVDASVQDAPSVLGAGAPDLCAPAAPEVVAPVWQVESVLPGTWVDLTSERQTLFNDAKASGLSKAMFRDDGRSFIADFDELTQTDFTSGEVCKLRLHTPPVGVKLEAEARVSDAGNTQKQPPAKIEHDPVGKDSSELAPGQTAEVPGSGGKPYTVKNCGGDVWSCTCVAWKMQGKKPTNLRSCKHIVSVRGAAAEDKRLARGGETIDDGIAAVPVARPLKGAPVSAGSCSANCEGEKPPPLLLANKWEERIDPTGWWISEKLDGMRAYWDPRKRCLLSRLGNPILCPEPFLATLPDVALDGELFLGRGRFQELMSVVKNTANIGRIAGPWKDVVYVVFDLPGHVVKFEERMELLRSQLRSQGSEETPPFARFHDQQRCEGRAHLDSELKRIQDNGGEGLMLRRAGSLYEAGRSSTLLKVKTFQDEEAVVLGHELGKGRNSEVTGALRCRNRAGIQFSVGSGLNDALRANPPKVGEIITYRFFELTKDNKPRFPSFVGIRADADPTGLEI